MKYGQGTLLEAIEGIGEDEWNLPGACGSWSMADIVAHMASYERLLEDILGSLLRVADTPYLRRMGSGPAAFNDGEVEARRDTPVRAVLDELTAAHGRAMALIARIPEEQRRQTGTLPWYGAEYALDDVLVYMYYGHKREHGAQIAAFRDRLKEARPAAAASAAGR